MQEAKRQLKEDICKINWKSYWGCGFIVKNSGLGNRDWEKKKKKGNIKEV